MNNITSVLELLIAGSGHTGKEIASKIGLPNTTFHKIQSGSTVNPTIENVTKIADYFGISVDQLIGKAPLNNFFEQDLVCIPVISLKETPINSIGSLTIENYKHWQRMQINGDLKTHNLFAIKVTGGAMSPIFDEKTIAIIDCNQEIKNKSLVLAYIDSENDYVIRRVNIDGAYKLLKPFNPDFPLIHLSEKDKIVGVVVSARKDFV